MKNVIAILAVLCCYEPSFSHHITKQMDPHTIKYFGEWRVAESSGQKMQPICFINSSIMAGDETIGWTVFSLYHGTDEEEFSITLKPDFKLKNGLDKSQSSFVGSLYSKYWLMSKGDTFWLEDTKQHNDLVLDHFVGGLFLSLVGDGGNELRYDLSQNGARKAYNYAKDVCLQGADEKQLHFEQFKEIN